MKTTMQKNFAEIESTKLPRSKFNRSFDLKTTFSAGDLIPVMLDELVPGDQVSLSASAVVRLATPIYPLMDNLTMDIQFFAVPCRLVWDNWQKFMGERVDPADTIDQYTIPSILRTTRTDFQTLSLFDYMGLPPDCIEVGVSALPFRAYNLIWNEWYRDQNLQDTIPVETDDTDDVRGQYVVQKRNKRHDYFTSCLPWPQRQAGIAVPLTGDIPVTGFGAETQVYLGGSYTSFETGASSGTIYVDQKQTTSVSADHRMYMQEDPDNAGFPNIRADLSNSAGISITELRDFITLQQFSELDARGGTRYTEIIKSHFNVNSSDARLNRPEYLGSVSNTINIQPVQTTGGNDTNARPVGDLGATAFSTFGDKQGFTYSAEEHCYVIGIASVRADLTYSQGLPRLFTREVREDFYWPSFANLSEQPVFNYEINAGGTGTGTFYTDTFGYQERYAEYRSKRSELTGLMRPEAAGTLAAWHLSQELIDQVALNSDFIEENPPIDRVVAVPSEPDFIANIYFKYMCERPMPTYGVPGLNRL